MGAPKDARQAGEGDSQQRLEGTQGEGMVLRPRGVPGVEGREGAQAGGAGQRARVEGVGVCGQG